MLPKEEMLPQDYANKYLLISCLKLAVWLKPNYHSPAQIWRNGEMLSLCTLFKEEYKCWVLLPLGNIQSYCDSTVF